MALFWVRLYLTLSSDVPAGGLGLTAGHFAQLSMLSYFCVVMTSDKCHRLVALMCLAQLAYQFYLYP